MKNQFEKEFSPNSKHQLLRIAHDLIKAIEDCPGSIYLGGTVVKTKNFSSGKKYMNRQRIRELIELKFNSKYLIN